jgi:hypothetical protein
MERSKVIAEKRDAAQRTRRLAQSLTLAEDRANLLRFAQELEDEAARLEGRSDAGASTERHGAAESGGGL